jgi:hypothetical protein
MCFLSELFNETQARGRHARVPHVSIWYDDEYGWRATCGGVFCDVDSLYDSPEGALLSAFANAEKLAKRFGQHHQKRKGKTLQ